MTVTIQKRLMIEGHYYRGTGETVDEIYDNVTKRYKELSQKYGTNESNNVLYTQELKYIFENKNLADKNIQGISINTSNTAGKDFVEISYYVPGGRITEKPESGDKTKETVLSNFDESSREIVDVKRNLMVSFETGNLGDKYNVYHYEYTYKVEATREDIQHINNMNELNAMRKSLDTEYLDKGPKWMVLPKRKEDITDTVTPKATPGMVAISKNRVKSLENRRSRAKAAEKRLDNLQKEKVELQKDFQKELMLEKRSMDEISEEYNRRISGVNKHIKKAEDNLSDYGGLEQDIAKEKRKSEELEKNLYNYHKELLVNELATRHPGETKQDRRDGAKAWIDQNSGKFKTFKDFGKVAYIPSIMKYQV